jgi:glucuronate isomerase
VWHTIPSYAKLCIDVGHPDRLLPAEQGTRQIARRLYESTRALPIVSPHGHCDPTALAEDRPFGDPAIELVTRDHYLLRMLYSQGVPLESLGVQPLDGRPAETDGRQIWRTFAEHFHLFRGTPSKLWLEYTLNDVLGLDEPVRPETADRLYDQMCGRLSEEGFLPRALFDRVGIEFLATTDSALSDLGPHTTLRASRWPGRVVPTFRPDDVVDPERPDFRVNLERLGEVTRCDTSSWKGYLDAIRRRRAEFVRAGATASDHGHPSPLTADLPASEAEALFARLTAGTPDAVDAERFRGLMLVQMADMSMDDGLVLQLHAGAWRDHNPMLSTRFGPDVGADIPTPSGYVGALKPLLDRFGNEARLTVVVYTLDESTYSRELAPLAGHYPALRLGPPWWFFDSPEGMRRFYRLVTETAGFANTVGFNDDARSLLTIAGRHDVARRVNAGYLAELVAEHRVTEDDAEAIAADLAYHHAARAFRATP